MAAPRRHRRKLRARPLLVAGAGLAAVICGACGGGQQTPAPVGNLKPIPTCDAGVCLPDGGLPPDAGIFCNCPINAD
jgi:hypothetical protein